MKNLLLLNILLLFIISSCGAQKKYNEKLVKAIVNEEYYPAYYDYIFMVDELIKIYQEDTVRFKRDMDIFNRSDYGKSCVNFYFYKIKKEIKNSCKEYKSKNSNVYEDYIVDSVINSINLGEEPDYHKDWSEFYNCFFEDPGDEKNFSLFTLIFMEEKELINFLSDSDNKEYWNNSIILDLTVGGGDFIDNNKIHGTDILFEKTG